MAEIILITGGARSGKSRHAQQLAEKRKGKRLFVATCPVTDDEMQQRIERHRFDREDCGWQTIEETVDLQGVLNGNREYEVVLIDCLTLWINNLLFTDAGNSLDDEALKERVRGILEAAVIRPGVVILVTNEVGMGIVPENLLARRYRDLVGRCNQEVAAVADKVVLVTCGIPMTVKEKR
ncbi:MAG: bifunctional adenosylcobinamide kinase/adenosylcobinamide-phosphate guanylyltransferase [Proteobacteria bacterium]|nr:bifunctional adenosylcobinamide kinase/adenosylcobinamide-phosphate guanylyltransferase [Pseudomonadota bacterium]MBU1739531.1 bifunctional adenosylcobinamide kinase/adenosylcobinamide-phosphate guanylyltransferase [Pseudomonadota bacterium]